MEGVQVAGLSRPLPNKKPAQKTILLPEPKSILEVTEVAVEGGAVQYAFFNWIAANFWPPNQGRFDGLEVGYIRCWQVDIRPSSQ